MTDSKAKATSDVGHLSEKAYYSIKKNIILSLLLGPVWALIWFENMTACLNSAKRHKRRHPTLASLLASLVPGFDILYALDGEKRLSDLRENCGATKSRSKIFLGASIARTAESAIAIPLIIALIVVIGSGLIIPSLNIVPDEPAPLFEVERQEQLINGETEVSYTFDVNLLGGFANVELDSVKARLEEDWNAAQSAYDDEKYRVNAKFSEPLFRFMCYKGYVTIEEKGDKIITTPLYDEKEITDKASAIDYAHDKDGLVVFLSGTLQIIAIILVALILAVVYLVFASIFNLPTILFTTFMQLDVNDIVVAERATVTANEAERRARVEADREIPYDENAVLEVRHLRKTFPIGSSGLEEVIAVDDVSFKLMPGETLGIVGESGCGKTTLGRAILKLHEPSDGQIIFNGEDITNYTKGQMRRLRTDMQIIFQDPYSSLPPRSTVGDILSEPVNVHNIVPKAEVKDYVLNLMEKCGLRDYYYERFPHEFSGGQRQRICIARALAVNPKLVVCDEPVSALDVSIQAQIINLLKELQRSMNLTYLFISHDLSVVKYISDKIGVMYLGSMVEFGTKEEIFANPLHPYTKALFSAIPNPNPDVKMQRITLEGDIPSPANPPSGCRFHTRCPYATEKCKEVVPEYREYGNGHFAACHLCEEEAK